MEIQQPSGNFSIELDEPQDTLNLFDSVTLQYSVNTYGKKFARIVFYMDSVYITSYTGIAPITINSRNYSDGIHSLKLEVWAYSGSGSLADKSDSEFLIAGREWKVIIDNSTPPSPSIDSIFVHDGKLKITWNKFSFSGFNKYMIYRERTGGVYHGLRLVTEITDRHQNYWMDSEFLGGTYKYKIDVLANGNLISGKERIYSEETNYLLPLESDEDGNVFIKWKKNKYYSNFKKYIVTKTCPDIYPDQISTFVIDDINDTSFVDAGFGGTVTYSITTEGNNLSASVASNVKSIKMGNRFPGFQTIKYVPELNSIFLQNYLDCIRLDAGTLQQMSATKGNVFFSNSGSYAYTNYDGNYQPHSFGRINPLTFQSAGPKILTDPLLGYYSVNNFVTVLENGNCMYSGYRYYSSINYGPAPLILLSMDPAKILQKDSAKYDFYLSGAVTSKLNNGVQYILQERFLLKVQDNSFSVSRNNMELAACFSLSGDEYISLVPGKILINSCSNHALLSAILVDGTLTQPGLDPATGYLGAVRLSDNHYVIYDIQSGKLIKEISLLRAANYYMMNSYLISNMGYSMRLNFEN